MGKTTSIGWTDSTFNFAMGCKKISPGCANCYMFRYSKVLGRNPDVVELTKQGQAKNLNKRLDSLGEKIFINDMSDTFHEDIDDGSIASWITTFAGLPNHQFQVLTKRAERMYRFFNHWSINPVIDNKDTHDVPANVWLGVSVESQQYMSRIDYLRLIACKIHFVSFEPLLGPIEKPDLTNIQWIIIGGESGDNPRSMNPQWAQDIIDYTRSNYPDCTIFMKQLGGKGRDGAGGCILNGQEIKEFPKYQ